MKVRPNESFKMLSTSIHLIKDKIYDAIHAENIPGWEENGIIFIPNAENDTGETGFILRKGEYRIVMTTNKHGSLVPIGTSACARHGYYSAEPPEAFFGELVEKRDRKPGMIYVNDCRKPPHWAPGGKGVWISYYAFPTQLAKDMAAAYPLGVGPQSIEVIGWKNGQLLTIISNISSDSLRFQFEFWAGLTGE
jgi:hypothetical protein